MFFLFTFPMVLVLTHITNYLWSTHDQAAAIGNLMKYNNSWVIITGTFSVLFSWNSGKILVRKFKWHHPYLGLAPERFLPTESFLICLFFAMLSKTFAKLLSSASIKYTWHYYGSHLAFKQNRKFSYLYKIKYQPFSIWSHHKSSVYLASN